MNEVTMAADKLLDMVSKFVFDAKSDKDWEVLHDKICEIHKKADVIESLVRKRFARDKGK